MKELRRTRQGYFSIDDSISINDLEISHYKFISIDDALKDIKFISVDENLEKKISDGAILNNNYNESMIGFKNSNNEVIAIYKTYNKDISKIKPLKVFNNIE